MALSEHDRKSMLADLGLDPEGEHLSLAPEPEPKEPEPQDETPVQTGVETDVEELTDEQLLAPRAFDRYKLSASQVGRATSSPHNKRLYRRIQEATDRQRKAEHEAKREAKANSKRQERGFVREQVKADTVHRTAQGVLEAMAEAGVDLDTLVELIQEKKNE